jgi:hypothetical protein
MSRRRNEIISPFDMAGIPAVAVEGGAPPQPVDQDLDALVGQLVDLVRIENGVFDLVKGGAGRCFVVGPLGLAFANSGAIAPIQHGRIIASWM